MKMFFSKKNNLIVIFGFILISVAVFQCIAVHAYSPVIELEYKYGNKRGLGRTGVLIPILQSDTKLFYTSAFFMRDSKKASEGNFGLGYRHKFAANWIAGGYGFWDIRRTKYENMIHQATFGVELLG